MSEKLLGVIGDPIEHSLSPALFEFVIHELQLPYRYQAFHVRAQELKIFLEKVRAQGIAGVNVTIPHKERVISSLDALHPQAQKMGAVNTIANERGRLMGYNTDMLGFIRSLQTLEIDLRDRKAVVLGAGGVAKTVVYALIGLGSREVAVGNRTLKRAKELAAQACLKTGFEGIHCCELDDLELTEAIKRANLLVNATSVGMYPQHEACPLSDLSCLHSNLIVYDLIYNPLKTRLLKEAEARGAEVMAGLDMLIYQGLESLSIWTEEGLTFSEQLLQRVRRHVGMRLRAFASDF